MASLFTARRKPKRVASADSREDSSQAENDTGPVVRRPTAAAKLKSKLRISFDPSESTADDVTPPTVTKPSRSGESAAGITLPHYRSGLTARQEQDGPVYSKSYLEELKGSTPSTPKDLSLYNSSAEDDVPSNNRALDLAAKFGTQATLPTSAIPSAAEIQEKKDRRARLAKEQQAAALLSSSTGPAGGSISHNDDYISLDAYNSDGEFKPSRLQVASFTKADHLQAAQEHTRLVPEDEDIAEGFDSFVDDDDDHTNAGGSSNRNRNRILMSRAANQRSHGHDHDRETLRALIDEAEGASPRSDDEDDDKNGSVEDNDSDSDASLQHAYNAAQTSRGTAGYGQHSETAAKTRRRAERDAMRPRQPEKTTPIPTLAVAVARLRELAAQADAERQRAETSKREIERRLGEVEGEKGRIQQGLEELGRQLQEASISMKIHQQSQGQNQSGRDDDVDGGGEELVMLDGQPQPQRQRNGNGNERERIERGLDNIGDG